MLTIKNITLKNFLSTGAVTQAINFDSKELTLILGENLDLGGDGSRNGTGKTTLIQALCYGLYGNPINNIRKDNLINRTNGKNMLVTIEFSVNGTEYRIERGRKPNVLKFYVDNNLLEKTDDAQGENKETQQEIERVLNMSQDMFKHVVTLNTYTEPFLALRANDQRNIIEQLLGITLLSEKAELIKEKIRKNKEDLQEEEFRIKAIEEANVRVHEQIDSLKRRQNLWAKKHKEDLDRLTNDYKELSKIDIDAELLAHKELNEWVELKKRHEERDALVARQTAWLEKREKDVNALNKKLEKLNKLDIEKELEAHTELEKYKILEQELDGQLKEIDQLEKEIKKLNKDIDKSEEEVKTLKEHKCYACGQDFHDEQHAKVLKDKQSSLKKEKENVKQKETELSKLKDNLVVLPDTKPKTHYKTEIEAVKHFSEIENLENQIKEKNNEVDPYSEQLSEMNLKELGAKPKTHYDTETEAIEHRSTVANLETAIESKTQETDPYAEQVEEMESQALQEIEFDKINELTRLGEHYKFLLDLLTNKNSFVRKKIIDQNLSYLNSRLTNYLDKIGLPHQVVFQNDLSVEITELGRELDFDNLSRGERNRLILGMSFAFRDVWENLYFPINTLFIDELVDSGMDTSGVENSLAILKDMSRRRQKSIWLVSHREELAGRVSNTLKVVKENGFTTFNTTTDIE